MATFTEREAKPSVLIVRKLIDGWFWEKYGVNPYNGCQFGCVYCDSRSQKYFLPSDFENDIVVKTSIGPVLDRRLTNARTLRPDVVGLGGTTDPYQPAESVYHNSRSCLEVLAKHRYPVHVITKSRLVLEDLELLERIGQETWCAVSLTITTANPDVARFLETKTPSPQERFDVIRTFKAKAPHVKSGVLLIPVVPFLGDAAADFERLLACARDAGADYVIFGGGMTMRDLQALWFMKHVRAAYPGLVARYEELYGFKDDPEVYTGSYEPRRDYHATMWRRFGPLAGQYGMPLRIRRYIPNDFRRVNYMIAERLLDESYTRQIAGGDWKGPFWLAQNIQGLKEDIRQIAERRELRLIRGMTSQAEQMIEEQIAVSSQQ